MTEDTEGTLTETGSSRELIEAGQQTPPPTTATKEVCRAGGEHRFLVLGQNERGVVKICTKCGAVVTEYFPVSPYQA